MTITIGNLYTGPLRMMSVMFGRNRKMQDGKSVKVPGYIAALIIGDHSTGDHAGSCWSICWTPGLGLHRFHYARGI